MAGAPDSQGDAAQARAGRRAALALAATGVAWIAVTWLGAQLGWSNRTRALFDLAALAAFGWCLWMIVRIWRQRRDS